MFLVLWEYEVKPGYEERFERVYGPGDDWDSLFQRDASYAGTHLFRDMSSPACISLPIAGVPEKRMKSFFRLTKNAPKLRRSNATIDYR
jgi:hypothetical protein